MKRFLMQAVVVVLVLKSFASTAVHAQQVPPGNFTAGGELVGTWVTQIQSPQGVIGIAWNLQPGGGFYAEAFNQSGQTVGRSSGRYSYANQMLSIQTQGQVEQVQITALSPHQFSGSVLSGPNAGMTFTFSRAQTGPTQQPNVPNYPGQMPPNPGYPGQPPVAPNYPPQMPGAVAGGNLVGTWVCQGQTAEGPAQMVLALQPDGTFSLSLNKAGQVAREVGRYSFVNQMLTLTYTTGTVEQAQVQVAQGQLLLAFSNGTRVVFSRAG